MVAIILGNIDSVNGLLPQDTNAAMVTMTCRWTALEVWLILETNYSEICIQTQNFHLRVYDF